MRNEYDRIKRSSSFGSLSLERRVCACVCLCVFAGWFVKYLRRDKSCGSAGRRHQLNCDLSANTHVAWRGPLPQSGSRSTATEITIIYFDQTVDTVSIRRPVRNELICLNSLDILCVCVRILLRRGLAGENHIIGQCPLMSRDICLVTCYLII